MLAGAAGLADDHHDRPAGVAFFLKLLRQSLGLQFSLAGIVEGNQDVRL
jgi:hypothetical protein